MEKETDDRREVELLCKECGHAFKAYVDRLTSKTSAQAAQNPEFECPVCGCGECRIGR